MLSHWQIVQEVSLLSIYFKFGKYLFLVFLFISFYIITRENPNTLGLDELILGFVFPAIPVWAAFYYFPLLNRDLRHSNLRYLTITAPLIVICAEAYPITIFGLMGTNSPLGLLVAFGAGAICFFLLFGLVLLSVALNRSNIGAGE